MPRVLIVDDEPAIRRAFSRILSERGVEVHVAEDGLRAEQLIGVQVEPFDAIVTDISMPHIDGIELLHRIRQIDPDVPVLLITGVPKLETAMRAVRLGAFRYIQKPVPTEEFAEEVMFATQVGRLARAKRLAQTHFGRASAAPVDLAGLESALNHALESMWMAYQPIVAVESREIVAYEALLRFDSPAFKGPTDLLLAAEELDRTHDIGRRVRARIAADLVELPAGVDVFVNLHPTELSDPELNHGPLTSWAERVVLEVTERQSLQGDVSAIIEDLRGSGFRIAVDDLGAGYSGLSSFAALRPDVVKLDMSLSHSVDADDVLQTIVRSILGLCREFGTRSVVEGVETPAELDTLRRLGIDLAQGFLFGRPQRGFTAIDEAAWR